MRLFKRFSDGSLKLKEDAEIKTEMQFYLTWNVAKISCESQFSNTYKGKDSEFTESKTKYVTDGRISRILSANWKKFKLQYPIFDKLPHFAIFRLKVNGKRISE